MPVSLHATHGRAAFSNPSECLVRKNSLFSGAPRLFMPLVRKIWHFSGAPRQKVRLMKTASFEGGAECCGAGWGNGGGEAYAAGVGVRGIIVVRRVIRQDVQAERGV